MRQGTLVSFLAHVAVNIDEPLGPELLLDELASLLLEFLLLVGQEVGVLVVNSEALMEIS